MTKQQLDDLITLIEATARLAKLEASTKEYRNISIEAGKILDVISQKKESLKNSVI